MNKRRLFLIYVSLVLLFLPPDGRAEDTLLKLLDGTSNTPAVSGLQISTIRRGEVFENFAFGIAQTSAQGHVPLRLEHNKSFLLVDELNNE